ncbi:hypothetical protein C0995_015164 [Termitomyces sp. Mi166|nr:hypothetical protein C0995_015164 [Termitomyces sp. Mi166\
MTSSANAHAHANFSTVSSTHISPVPPVTPISPSWAPPKSPLSPHRLAKLANALGVSTPMPATHRSTPFMTRSFLEPPTTPDPFRRSPTPSTVSSNFTAYSSTVSKYLLHVIPPMHLPHDTDNDTDMTPPPASASGYHTQFRRGILIPVHSNLQAQLCAIAKEYALPSTAGMILYLVIPAQSPQTRPIPGVLPDELDEPGPRLSEDIWRHLWTRVLKAEQRDDILIPPLKSRLGMSLETQSTPDLPQDSDGQPLRPFLSSASETAPILSTTHIPPSPTTPSTISDLRSNTRSVPPSESSGNDPETPDTSLAAPSIFKDLETHANSLDLPGLTSPSIIPILAKVEFDIDCRKATWYGPWLRSRRLNHVKRTESRNGKQASQGDSGDNSDDPHEHPRHIGLLTGNKEAQSTASSALSSVEGVLTTEPDAMLAHIPTPEGYQQLDEQEEGREEGDGWSDDDSVDDEFESTARVTTLTQEDHKDALADIFGTDAETWAGMKSTSPRKSISQTNPNVVDLVLNAADLTALPSPTESELEKLGKEEDEVQALLDQMARPTLSVSIPAPSNETGSSMPAPVNKKHVPPPLTLVANPPSQDLAIPIGSSPSSASSSGLAYLHDDEVSPGEDQEGEFERDYTSPAESLKREGAVFDDLDLGLDPTEDYDESDPNDRRHSQFLMKAQLDEIERTMAQLSPRILQDDLADEQQKYLSLSPTNPITLSPGFPSTQRFRTYELAHIPASADEMLNSDSPPSKPQAAWPATPFASIKNVASPRRDDPPPSPPRLAVNGVTASAPKSLIPDSSGKMSEESELRKRELEEEQGYHRRPIPLKSSIDANSGPIIPLSPDPFGRFSSTPPPPPGEQQSSAYWEKDAVPDISNISAVDIPPPIDSPDGRKRTSSSATSRFSADSITGIEANSKSNRSTLMSVNTIKKLWKKNTKASSSKLPSIPSGSSTPPLPPVPPHQSLDKLNETPKNPISGRISPQPPPRLLKDMLPPPVPQVPPQQLSVPVMAQQPRTVPQSPSQLPQSPQSPLQGLAPPVPPKPRSPVPHPQHLSQPSLSQQRPPISFPSQQSQHPAPPQQQVTMPRQLSVSPLFNGTSMNPQPIVATQMRPGRSNSSLDHFQFDQESPYPVTTRRTRANSRPLSPPIPSSSPLTTHLPPPTPTSPNASFSPMAPPAPPQEKPPVRKSILKGWKSSSISSIASMQMGGVPESRTSFEQPNADGARSRRPSILNLSSSRISVTSPSPDIPPSPKIPQQFIVRNDKRQSIRSRLTNSSIDSSHALPHLSAKLSGGSTRRSTASSRSSQDSRPSFDTSQFEMVSPKMGSALPYPYPGPDH